MTVPRNFGRVALTSTALLATSIWLAPDAEATTCLRPGYPAGCAARPTVTNGVGVKPGIGAGAPGAGVTPGVGVGARGVGVAPGVGVGAPGVGVAPRSAVNRGGPVNRPGVR